MGTHRIQPAHLYGILALALLALACSGEADSVPAGSGSAAGGSGGGVILPGTGATVAKLGGAGRGVKGGIGTSVMTLSTGQSVAAAVELMPWVVYGTTTMDDCWLAQEGLAEDSTIL